jgi:hypothetical protein
VLQFVVTANVVFDLLIHFTLTIEAKHSSEAVLTITTQRHPPEDGILHSRRNGNLKSYIALNRWSL